MQIVCFPTNRGKHNVKENKMTTAEKRVLTIGDVVELTGYTKDYIYKLVWLKEIPHYKPNKKRLYFERGEIENWMLQGRVTTKAEAAQQAALRSIQKGGIR